MRTEYIKQERHKLSSTDDYSGCFLRLATYSIHDDVRAHT